MPQKWIFEPTVNLGHIIMLVGLLGGGLSVYIGVFQTLTRLDGRVQHLEEVSNAAPDTREIAITNRAGLTELRSLTADIRDSNAKMLEQLTSIRIDIATIKASQITPSSKNDPIR